MLKTISEALEKFCEHQIRSPHSMHEGIFKEKTIITYIDIETLKGEVYRVYIASEINFMQKISTLFLEEDKSDEETLIDVALETTNLIVGSAKVISEETNNNPYTISTPHFSKIAIFNFEYDQAKHASIENDKMAIAIKELH